MAPLAHAGCSTFGAEETPAPSGTDGGASSDSGVGFCEQTLRTPEPGTTLVFCNDFDKEQPITQGFAAIDLVPRNDPIARDLTEAVSPPASFLARLGPAAGTCSFSRAIKWLEGSTSHVRVRADVRLGEEGSPPEQSFVYLVVKFGTPTESRCRLNFLSDANPGIVEQRPLTDGGLASAAHLFDGPAIAPGRKAWTTLALDANRTTGSIEVTFDGKPAFVGPQTLGQECLGGSGDVTIYLGVHCSETTTAPKVVRFDNVLVRTVP